MKRKHSLWVALLLASVLLGGCSALDATASLAPALAAFAPAPAEAGSLAAQVSTPEAAASPTAAQPITVTVSGVVKNGTANASVPSDLQVRLHSFGAAATDTGAVATFTTTLSADGAYRFENVPAQVGGQIIVSAQYENVLYTSEAAKLDASQLQLETPLTVTVYETTTESTGLHVEQMHLFLNFASGQVTVGELYVLSNVGDRTIVNPQGSVQLVVPPGAIDLNVQGEQEGTDYVRTAQGFAETSPIIPGSGTGQSLFTFSLPYTGQLSLEQKVLYPVTAAGVLMPDVGVKLQSSQLQDQGVQDIQGSAYHIYGMNSLPPGGLITFQLSGQPGSASPAAQPAFDPRSAAVGVGALGVVLAGVGVWLYRRSRGGEALPGNADADQENLLQAIADLDDAFDKNEIEAETYARRRARLKAKLVELMAPGNQRPAPDDEREKQAK